MKGVWGESSGLKARGPTGCAEEDQRSPLLAQRGPGRGSEGGRKPKKREKERPPIRPLTFRIQELTSKTPVYTEDFAFWRVKKPHVYSTIPLPPLPPLPSSPQTRRRLRPDSPAFTDSSTDTDRDINSADSRGPKKRSINKHRQSTLMVRMLRPPVEANGRPRPLLRQYRRRRPLSSTVCELPLATRLGVRLRSPAPFQLHNEGLSTSPPPPRVPDRDPISATALRSPSRGRWERECRRAHGAAKNLCEDLMKDRQLREQEKDAETERRLIAKLYYDGSQPRAPTPPPFPQHPFLLYGERQWLCSRQIGRKSDPLTARPRDVCQAPCMQTRGGGASSHNWMFSRAAPSGEVARHWPASRAEASLRTAVSERKRLHPQVDCAVPVQVHTGPRWWAGGALPARPPID